MAPNAVFTQKLHLIYLINDLLHHWLVKFQLKSLKKKTEISPHIQKINNMLYVPVCVGY